MSYELRARTRPPSRFIWPARPSAIGCCWPPTRCTARPRRHHTEREHPYRGPFQRDRDRIVHSAAYRRLSAKTQVFTGELGDYHRTRLTHTIEVASVRARSGVRCD